jgi:aminomethyltransferase
MAYVSADAADSETFTVKGARTTFEAVRTAMPFYTEGTARRKLG